MLELILILVAVIITIVITTRSTSTKIKTIYDCEEGRDCPYRVIIHYSGGFPPKTWMEVDRKSMFKCCRTQKQLNACRELTNNGRKNNNFGQY